MPIDLKEYQTIKARVEMARREKDRAEGAMESQMRTLKEKFGCSSVDEAETKLQKLKSEASEAEQKYNDKLKDFKEKWKSL